MIDQVRCSGCGRFRPRRPASTPDQVPCPRCGGTALTISASFMATAMSDATAVASLQPGDQGRGWERRWQDIQDEAPRVLAPITSAISGEDIQRARRRVLSFYITAFHLKDALIAAAPTTGISPKRVEDAVNAEPELALLADLANLDKHEELTRRTHSGHAPREVRRAGATLPGSPSPGWQLQLEFEHNGVTVDGLKIVQQSVDAWRRVLQGWGLIN